MLSDPAGELRSGFDQANHVAVQVESDRKLMTAASHAFDTEALEVRLVFATNIALAWTMMRQGDQIRSALASRDVIGQAKGMIMERYPIDAVRAFALLKRLSQSSNSKLVDIAVQLIESEGDG